MHGFFNISSYISDHFKQEINVFLLFSVINLTGAYHRPAIEQGPGNKNPCIAFKSRNNISV